MLNFNFLRTCVVFFILQLRNTDHTNTVIDKVLDKYGIIHGRHDDYCLLQQMSDGG